MAKPVMSIERLIEKYGPIPPLPIRNGIVHFHALPKLGSIVWVVRNTGWPGICGTERCIKLEVKFGSNYVECVHDPRPPEFGEMICRNCNQPVLYELVMPAKS